MENSNDQSKPIKIAGLWKAETQSGLKYLTGPLGLATIAVFENKFKSDPKQPDFYITLQAKNKKPGDSGNQSQNGFF